MATWRRKHRARQQWYGFVEYSGNTYEEATMAVAGSATAAYRCTVEWGDQGGVMRREFTTLLRTDCATVDDAVRRLQAGETVTVAGSDMEALRTRMAGLGVVA